MNRLESGFLPHRPEAPEAINADSFDEDVREADGFVIVEFWGARCAACRRLAPELQEIARTGAVPLRVLTLDVDQELPAAVRCGIVAIPALVLFWHGRERARLIGPQTRRQLIDFIETHTRRGPDAQDHLG
jgi:thioredoxin 1